MCVVSFGRLYRSSSSVRFLFFRMIVVGLGRVKGLFSVSKICIFLKCPTILVVFCMLFLLVFGSVCAVVEEWTDCINSFCESICHYACGSFRAEVFD